MDGVLVMRIEYLRMGFVEFEKVDRYFIRLDNIGFKSNRLLNENFSVMYGIFFWKLLVRDI